MKNAYSSGSRSRRNFEFKNRQQRRATVKERTRTRSKQPDLGCPLTFSQVRKSALAKIKAEAVRLGNNGTREGLKYAERLFRALPELRDV